MPTDFLLPSRLRQLAQIASLGWPSTRAQNDCTPLPALLTELHSFACTCQVWTYLLIQLAINSQTLQIAIDSGKQTTLNQLKLSTNWRQIEIGKFKLSQVLANVLVSPTSFTQLKMRTRTKGGHRCCAYVWKYLSTAQSGTLNNCCNIQFGLGHLCENNRSCSKQGNRGSVRLQCGMHKQKQAEMKILASVYPIPEKRKKGKKKKGKRTQHITPTRNTFSFSVFLLLFQAY